MIYQPGIDEPIEAIWVVNGQGRIDSAWVTFRTFTGSTEQFWNGTQWVTSNYSFPMAHVSNGLYRYMLSIPTSWVGKSIQVTCSMLGQADLSDEMLVQNAPSSSGSVVYGGRLG